MAQSVCNCIRLVINYFPAWGSYMGYYLWLGWKEFHKHVDFMRTPVQINPNQLLIKESPAPDNSMLFRCPAPALTFKHVLNILFLEQKDLVNTPTFLALKF